MTISSDSAVLEQLQNLLSISGYAEAQIRRDEAVWTPRRTVRAPVLAFADSYGRFDPTTATVVAGFADRTSSSDDELLEAAISLAAPVLLHTNSDGVTLRSINADGMALFEESYDWDDAFRGLPQSLNPRVLLDAKLGHRQGTLFPVDANLLVTSRDRTESALGPRVANMLDAAADVLERQPFEDPAERHAKAARFAIGALTAVVLRDKEFGGHERFTSSGQLFDVALQLHPAQFAWASQMSMWESEIVDRLIDELSDVDFSFAEPILLSRIYESRLVSNAARRQLGAHYTPPELAKRMLQFLPVEELDPAGRKVLDPTSGSGTLLLAAHDRLAALQPKTLTLATAHTELAARLHGTDKDPVAVEIANLSLLLHALPAGNGWKVTEGDALRPQRPRPEYDIVVANPPWAHTNRGQHNDVAHDFLDRMLRRLKPGGLLGVVLPAAWLTRVSSRESRELLRRRCDVFEVWRLPAGTFEGAQSGAAVVLARRVSGKRVHRSGSPSAFAGSPYLTGAQSGPLIFKDVHHRRDLPAFYDSGRAGTALALGPSDEVLASGPLSRWWNGSARTRYTLRDFAEAVTGPQPASERELELRGVREALPNVDFLRSPSQVGPFARVEAHHLTRVAFPVAMQQGLARGGAGLSRRKVLIPATMSPNVAWRLGRVALDETGALPQNTATQVLPLLAGAPDGLSEDEILFGLLAFLGSGFASSFVADTIQTRNIGTRKIEALPTPDPATLRSLAQLGRELADAATNRDEETVAALRVQLERLVWDWSQVPDALREVLIARLDGRPVSVSTGSQSISAADRRVWTRAGRVTGVDPELGIRLSIAGMNKLAEGDPLGEGSEETGQWVGIPSRFPGAAARLGSKFLVRLRNGDSLLDAEYGFDELAYMSDDDVVAALLVDPEPVRETADDLAPASVSERGADR